MTDEIKNIINETEELSYLLKSHPKTLTYKKSTEKLKNDPESQKLLSRLIAAGKEINEQHVQKEKIDFGAEHKLIQEELDSNLFLKSYLQIQKDYLDLIREVMAKIQDPT